MLICNLSVLLAERNLSITQVSHNTGISRTTLTSLASNHSKGIQFDTLNELCIYLNISPEEFFVHIPFDILLTKLSFKTKNNIILSYSLKHLSIESLDLLVNANYETESVYEEPGEMLIKANFHILYTEEFKRLGVIPRSFFAIWEDEIRTAFLCECFQMFPITKEKLPISISWDSKFFQ